MIEDLHQYREDMESKVACRTKSLHDIQETLKEERESLAKRVEMRTRDRAEHRDQDNEDSTGWDGIAQKRDGDVPVCQPLGHYAGAYNGCQKRKGSEPFGNEFAQHVRLRCFVSVS